MAHIFISYSKQDMDFARYLRALLEHAGFAVWMDEVRLQPSARWWKSIEQNIESCAVFVVVMSPHAAESDWVEREILLAEKLRRPIYPVLLAGEAWSRLANIQYEDMRAGLRAKPSAGFLHNLRARLPDTTPRTAARSIILTIREGDVTKVKADVVALKHASSFYGADQIVAYNLTVLAGLNQESLEVKPDEYCLVPTENAIAAARALFVGTPPPRHFGYRQIREFTTRVLDALTTAAPDTRHLAMTIHGPGFGLDEVEALRSQFAGYLDSINQGRLPPALERITILEISPNRVKRLRAALDAQLEQAEYAEPLATGWGYRLHVGTPQPSRPAEPETPGKRHAFVLMPPTADAEDVFFYGIQSPIHALGLLCERVEQSSLDDDLLDQVKRRIETAAVVVADLTAADPRVYLQLGYAWGKGRPTILLAKAGSRLALDSTRYAPIVYERIKDVDSALAQSLDALKAEGLL